MAQRIQSESAHGDHVATQTWGSLSFYLHTTSLGLSRVARCRARSVRKPTINHVQNAKGDDSNPMSIVAWRGVERRLCKGTNRTKSNGSVFGIRGKS